MLSAAEKTHVEALKAELASWQEPGKDKVQRLLLIIARLEKSLVGANRCADAAIKRNQEASKELEEADEQHQRDLVMAEGTITFLAHNLRDVTIQRDKAKDRLKKAEESRDVADETHTWTIHMAPRKPSPEA